jgi:hypothetical protein
VELQLKVGGLGTIDGGPRDPVQERYAPCLIKDHQPYHGQTFRCHGHVWSRTTKRGRVETTFGKPLAVLRSHTSRVGYHAKTWPCAAIKVNPLKAMINIRCSIASRTKEHHVARRDEVVVFRSRNARHGEEVRNAHALIQGHRNVLRIHIAGDRTQWQSVATTAMHRRLKSEEEGSSMARR